MCPITHVLALALADNALDARSITSAQDILALERGKGAEKDEGVLRLKCRPEMRDVPIFRRYTGSGNTGAVSSTTPLGQSLLAKYMEAAAKEAGFRQQFKPYSLRRAAGKEVDGTSRNTAFNAYI